MTAMVCAAASMACAVDIPKTLGTVSDAYLPNPNAIPDYVLIQDVHHHAEVQGKIANLILYGYDHWGARRIFTEGAFSKVDLTVFHRLPDATRRDLLQRLINEGNLSGPELATVIVSEREWRNPSVWPMQLVGMENVSLYLENLRLFRDLQRLRGPALQEVDSLSRLNKAMNLPEPNILGSELGRARDLLELRLTPRDYALYLSARNALPESAQLRPALRVAEAFYAMVNSRSSAFLKESQRKLPAGNGPRILVVGGFHTSYMAEQLKQRGISYIVLSPAITQRGDQKAYEHDLLNSIDTLAFSRHS